MMTLNITHHPPQSLLLAYSAGQLPQAYSLVVATHLSICDHCRTAVEALDSVGGALLETTNPVPLRPDALAKTMQRIDGGEQSRLEPKAPIRVRRAALENGEIPAPLHDYIGASIDTVAWAPLGGGVRQAVLPTSDRPARARLIHIPAGMSIPDHGHRGLELTMVLQGAYNDGQNRFSVGDLDCVDETTDHNPVAAPDQDCICLIATDAPLKFSALLPRLAQPFFRI